MNRYLLVTTRINEDKFPEPELTPLPQLPGEQDSSEDSSQNGEEESAEEAGESNDQPVDTTEIEAERERIKRENQRKLDAHEESVEEARQRVRELNARFADWYYVISEDTFRQIHLSTSDVVTEREDAAETGFNIDAFRSLQEEGLEVPEEEETEDELESELPFDLGF